MSSSTHVSVAVQTSSEPAPAFYERLQPFAVPFMALFERDRLPSRSALSRFLAALTQAPVDALRTFFLDDLLSHLSVLS